ncbi:MAG: Type III restriction enzyme, res subunit superfamily [Parcubacteria group bacterium GW2011_GWA2_47_26]|uniref:Type III restriction enzyme, res subunit superfamily n=1 Tax=Candidatus Magasanikbacteria bacterium GW2011_GWC2_45_8 TaxID=1619050 RepID=A0A0G1Q513_9BACT|nr:MAG: Type III restriction enzyme, res subunit superfamily [Candidatus Magasanikbacteria bacterium GW2011_GWC2_45_8]KKU73808.1 MAG: Type III restriction enzyme, res subunit superfamily [Parcubacteria group bacterium GW2011_GWA2_47_26]
MKAYKRDGVDINPLVLIQLPDRKGSSEDRLRERVERILKDEHGITTEKGNNKLAVWLSGEHINKEDVERNDNSVEVLIFKQTPALGWDCPRAQILVLFREWHSQVFSIQTVGRIMRMPEPDKGYYENDPLNYAYVCTNLNDIDIQEDIARKYITIYTSRRKKQYQSISLTSYHTVRHREKTRLSPEFTDIFLKTAEDLGLAKKINKKEEHTSQTLISDWHTENINLAGAGMVKEATTQYAVGNIDLQRYFDFFVRRSLRHFYPEDRTVGRVKTTIYKFLSTN